MHAHVHLFTSHHLHFRYLILNHRRYHRALARLVRAFLSLPPRCTGHKCFLVLPSLTASLWVWSRVIAVCKSSASATGASGGAKAVTVVGPRERQKKNW